MTPDPLAPGLLSRLPRPPRKVAVLRASRIGDFLCATPAIRAIRSALPDAEITMITLPMLRDLVERSPHLDAFAPFPGYPGIAEQLFDPCQAAAFLQRMRAKRFDLAIQMQGSGVNSNPFTLLLGAAATAGFIRPGDLPGRLDAALPLPPTGHEVEHVLALTSFLGIPAHGTATEFPLWPADRAAADTLVASATPPLLGLHPGARARARRWPPERFAEAGAALRARHGGTLVIVGDAWERDIADAVAAHLGGACLNLAGQTSLPVLGAVLARLAVLLTNDTGPAHIAYALHTPSVTVFGGADPRTYGPPPAGPHRIALRDVRCRPTGPTTCPACPFDYACLTGVTISQVVGAAESVIAGVAV